MSGSTDSTKTQRKQERKHVRRETRAVFQIRLSGLQNNSSYSKRNALMTEICKSLGQTTNAFKARWTETEPLTVGIVQSTPFFWYRRHKWTYKEVRELFKICSIFNGTVDKDLTVVYGIDAEAKAQKKKRQLQIKDKHLRHESLANLKMLRNNSLSLLSHRALGSMFRDESKSRQKTDNTGRKIWKYLTKNMQQPCEQLNQDQFNIALNDNNIKADPDVCLDLFYEIFQIMEKLDQYNRKRRMKNQKSQTKVPQNKAPKNSALLINLAISSTKAQHILGAPASPTSPKSPKSPYLNLNTAMGFPSKDEDEDEDGDQEPTTSEKMKFVKKKTIILSNIQRLIRFISKNVRRDDLLIHPSKVSPKKKFLVIFHKIFENILHQHAFDIENDYLSQRLTTTTLSNYLKIMEILETRETDWKDRLQVLEYLESNLETNQAFVPFFEHENFLLLVVAWTGQMFDERSNLTKVAAELFPSLFSQLIARVDIPAVIFEEEHQLVRCILQALFVLLKNKRAKTLAGIAHDVIIETIDILATIAEDLNKDAYVHMIQFLYEKSQYKNEKHDSVRRGCVVYALFLLFGTQDSSFETMKKRISASFGSVDSPHQIDTDTESIDEPSPAPSPTPSPAPFPAQSSTDTTTSDSKLDDNNTNLADGNDISSREIKKNVKMAKKCKRDFLFQDKQFMTVFGQIIQCGVEDRSKEVRDAAMKSLKKIETAEKQTSQTMFELYIGEVVLKKYDKWKKYSSPSKSKKNKNKNKRKRISRKAMMKMRKKQEEQEAN